MHALVLAEYGRNVIAMDINEEKIKQLQHGIGPCFLEAGAGYGGSCFPKDSKAIVSIGLEHQEEMLVIKAAIQANENQKYKMIEKIENGLNRKTGVSGAVIAVWGA